MPITEECSYFHAVGSLLVDILADGVGRTVVLGIASELG